MLKTKLIDINLYQFSNVEECNRRANILGSTRTESHDKTISLTPGTLHKNKT